jgi:hypothetical protein
MRPTPALLAVAVLAVPARSAVIESAVQARIASVMAGVSPYDVPRPAYEELVQAAPPAARAKKVNPPLIPRSYWESASPPHPTHLEWLKKRIPGLAASSVREIPYEAVAEVIDEAARRGWSTLDIFTDEGLRSDVSYYLSAATLRKLYANFDLSTALLASGRTTDGDAFTMDGLVMGRHQLHVLFNMGPFWFKNQGNTYKVESRVVQTIENRGRLAISGMWVDKGIVNPRIQRLVRIGPGRMRVETNYGSADQNDDPVKRR